MFVSFLTGYSRLFLEIFYYFIKYLIFFSTYDEFLEDVKRIVYAGNFEAFRLRIIFHDTITLNPQSNLAKLAVFLKDPEIFFKHPKF